MDFGGGKIKRNSIVILFLLTLALTLCISTAAATTTQNQTVKNASVKAAGSPSTSTITQTQVKAAGSTSTATSTITVTYSQLVQSSSSIKSFVDKYGRLPNYVTISGKQILMPQYLMLLSNAVVNLNSGKTSSITIKTISTAASPTQSVKSGALTKTEYVKIAGSLKSFINNYGRLPNYVSSSLGKIRYESLIYSYSKVVLFYATNKRLPNTVTVSPWKTTSGSSSTNTTTTDPTLTKYLAATANCQSTSTTIKTLAASITSGMTSTYSKAQAIFNWVRDHLTYSFYYNSVKGALGALSSGTANCCDTAHLVNALARAAGIPARYQHGYCKFSDGWFGHVWAQLYVNGTWYYADAISDYNTFGAINNWNVGTVTVYGTYAELPF